MLDSALYSFIYQTDQSSEKNMIITRGFRAQTNNPKLLVIQYYQVPSKNIQI